MPPAASSNEAADAVCYRNLLLILAALAVAIQLAVLLPSFGFLRHHLWGFHLAAYLPAWQAVLGWFVIAAGAIALAPDRPASARLIRRTARISRQLETRWGLVTVVIAIGAGMLFWLCRTQQDLLGDAWLIARDLPASNGFHVRQPLTVHLHHQLYQLLSDTLQRSGGDDGDIARTVIALGSVISGVLFAIVAAALGRVFVRDANARREASASTGDAGAGDDGPVERHGGVTSLLITLLLLSQGYSLLFYGYVENYSYYALSIGVYTLCAIEYLRARLPLIVPFGVVVVAIGLHLSGIVLLPSLVYLAASGLIRPGHRRSTVRDLVLGAVAVLLLDRVLVQLAARAAEPGYSLWSGLLGIIDTARLDQGGGSGWSYMFSARHLRDFANEQYLIGPLAAFLLVPALLCRSTRRERRNPVSIFLILNAVVLLVAGWLTSEPRLGYARDWDLFAPAGVALAAAGLFLMTTGIDSRARLSRLLLFALLLSGLHVGQWVAIHHSEPRSVARFADLPLGRGRTETVLGSWHLRRDELPEAAGWLERALEASPSNVNAHCLLGIVRLREDRIDEAIIAFRHAVDGRPDKVEYHQRLVDALLRAERYAETVPHLELICRREPDLYQEWHRLGDVLRRLDRDAAAVEAFERAFALAEQRLESDPADFQLAIDCGVLAASLDRPERAAAHFEHALTLKPDSAVAGFNLIYTLLATGRDEEAHPHMLRFLRLYPDHVKSAQIREWLQRTEAP